MGGHELCITAAAPAQKEPPSQPRLGELTASHVGPDSVQLEWSVPEGSFDSFTVQYKDAQGQPQVVPVDGGFLSEMGVGFCQRLFPRLLRGSYGFDSSVC